MGGTYQGALTRALLLLALVPAVLVAVVALVLLGRVGGDAAEVLAARTALAALAVALLVLAALAAVLSGLALGAPVQRLREGAALVAGPNRRHRLPPGGPAELAEVARALNALAAVAEGPPDAAIAEGSVDGAAAAPATPTDSAAPAAADASAPVAPTPPTAAAFDLAARELHAVERLPKDGAPPGTLRRAVPRPAPLGALTFVVFDLETTGLDPVGGDRVVQIGAVRVRGGRVCADEAFDTLVDPERPIPPASTRVHGIDDALVAGQPRLAEAVPTFLDYLGDDVPVAHVARFDLAFLNPALRAAGRPLLPPADVLDTLLLAQSLFPTWADLNLEGLAARFDLPVVGRHTALGDALLTAEILARLLPVLTGRGVTTLGAALALQHGTTWQRLMRALHLELHR